MDKHPLACPFCGCDAVVENDFGRDFWVQCEEGHVEGSMYKNPHEAVAEWNKRDTREVEALRAEINTLCQVCCGAKAGHHYSSCNRIDAAINEVPKPATKAAPPHAAWMDDVCGAGKDLPKGKQ